MRRKNLLYPYLPSGPSVLSSHCLLKQQDHMLTLSPSLAMCVFCLLPFILHDWRDASSIEGDGRRGDYLPSLFSARVAKRPGEFFFLLFFQRNFCRLELSWNSPFMLPRPESTFKSLATLFLSLRSLSWRAGQNESHMAHRNFTEHTNKLTHDSQGVNNKQDWIRHSWKSWNSSTFAVALNVFCLIWSWHQRSTELFRFTHPAINCSEKNPRIWSDSQRNAKNSVAGQGRVVFLYSKLGTEMVVWVTKASSCLCGSIQRKKQICLRRIMQLHSPQK